MNPGFDLMMPFPWDRVLWDEDLDLAKLLNSLDPSPDPVAPEPSGKKKR